MTIFKLLPRKMMSLIVLIGLFLITMPSLAEESSAQGDSSIVAHKKYPLRSPLENGLYFPFRVAYFPVKLTLNGIGMGIGYVDDSMILPRVVDALNSDDGRRGVIPLYSVQTGAGITYYEKAIYSNDLESNIIELTGALGNEGERLFRTSISEIPIKGGFASTDLKFDYTVLSAESYFGIGSDTQIADESGYAHVQTAAELKIKTSSIADFYLEGIAGIEQVSIEKGHEEDVPDISDSLSMHGVGPSVNMGILKFHLMRDSRNRPGNPTAGMMAKASIGIYQQSDDDLYGFTELSGDIQQHLTLRHGRTLILRAAGEVNTPFDNEAIPFFYLGELGSEGTIRGFDRGRFRDRSMVLGSIEYRYPLWRFWNEHGIDVALFTDAGKVFHDLPTEFSFEDYEIGYGFGFRLWSMKGLTSKLEFSWSEDDFRVYYTLN